MSDNISKATGIPATLPHVVTHDDYQFITPEAQIL
jgi:hypothetical protein